MIVTKTDQKANKIQASFPEYTGKKIFLVRHPDYQSGGGTRPRSRRGRSIAHGCGVLGPQMAGIRLLCLV